jgi:diguanylate cyclase
MDKIFSLLSSAVPAADSLEQLTRPLLDMLGTVTGYESTYLTTIDLDIGVQHVEFARNAGTMQIPEGMDVPWADTLCKRALDEGRTFTNNVADCWGDSEAATALGIQSYVSSPIQTQDGRLLGTLCAASAVSQPFRSEAEPTLKLFSKLLGTFMERELLVKELRSANTHLAQLALTDPLTSLLNRRAVLDELGRMLAHALRDNTQVLVGVIDMDGFKAINDTYGHQAGDQFLQLVTARIAVALRKGDLLGRLGGDEFVVIGPVSYESSHTGFGALGGDAAAALKERIFSATVGRFDIDGIPLDYSGASVGVISADPHGLDAGEAIKMADRAMYQTKLGRKGR